jgi:penicillin-insensitive murein endopeptidase
MSDASDLIATPDCCRHMAVKLPDICLECAQMRRTIGSHMRGKICAALLLALSVTLMRDGPSAAQSAGTPATPGAAAPSKSGNPVPPAPTPTSPAPKAPAPPAAPIVPAKELFGKVKTPAQMKARAIGFYAKGCLAGGRPIALDGPAWQAMRLSRNRYWGHPNLIRAIEKLAKDAKEHDGWRGLLIGDISQPRGGPMLTGHASHQVGLDADIWLTPMPDRKLTEREREDLSATSMLAADKVSVDPKVWTPAHVALIRRAASYPEVERVLVHPAIKKALCTQTSTEPEAQRAWLHKVRPYWGHHYHMHIRMGCPKGSDTCKSQPAPPHEDGCGREIDDWLRRISRPPPPPPPPPVKPSPPPKPMTLDQLPPECRLVLTSGTEKTRVRSPAKTETKAK